MNRLVLNHPLLTDLHPQRVEIHDRIHRLQRPRTPLPQLLVNLVRHLRDQLPRHRNPIQLLHMRPDLTRRHPPRIQRYHLLVEPRKAPCPLLDQLRLEAALSVPRNRQLHRTRPRQNPLPVVTVPVVPRNPASSSLARCTSISACSARSASRPLKFRKQLPALKRLPADPHPANSSSKSSLLIRLCRRAISLLLPSLRLRPA